MKNNRYAHIILLTLVLFVALCAVVIIRSLLPTFNLPPLNIPNMVLLSVIALLLEYLIAGSNPRCYLCTFLFGTLAFGLLPLMAGLACVHNFWKYGLVGGVVFAVITFLFSSAVSRMRTGPKAKAAVVVTSLGIYLASQCFAGILL